MHLRAVETRSAPWADNKSASRLGVNSPGAPSAFLEIIVKPTAKMTALPEPDLSHPYLSTAGAAFRPHRNAGAPNLACNYAFLFNQRLL